MDARREFLYRILLAMVDCSTVTDEDIEDAKNMAVRIGIVPWWEENPKARAATA